MKKKITEATRLYTQSARVTSIKIRVPSGAEFANNSCRHNDVEEALGEKDAGKTSGRDYLASDTQRDLDKIFCSPEMGYIPSTHRKES